MKLQPQILAGGALMATLALGGVASADIQVTLNDQPLATSVPPRQINGATMVPMRDIFEALGAGLNWNPLAQTITAQKDLTTIQLAINNPTAVVNGRNVVLSQPATLIDGKTFVPLRFVSEAMNARVQWNEALQLVSIRTNAPIASNPGPLYPPPPAPLPGTSPAAPYYPPTGAPVPPPAPALPATDPNSPLYVAPPTQPIPVQNRDRDRDRDWNRDRDRDRDRPGIQAIAVPAGVVVPVEFDQAISSATARVGDRVTATIVSRKLGDSEFPGGTKLEATIVEAQPRQKDKPGVLDFEFRNAILPGGERIPIRGELTALDNSQVQTQNGRIVAREAKSSDKLKVVGIGAGAGFVLGRVLDTNSTLTTILGAAGGYLVGRAQDKKAAEAQVPARAMVGVALRDPVRYRDANGYYPDRQAYLRGLDGRSADFDSGYYGVDASTAGPRRGDRASRFDGYETYDNAPVDIGNPVNTTRPPAQPWDRDRDRDRDGNWNNAGANTPRDDRRPVYQTISIPEGVVIPVTLDEQLSSANAREGQIFETTVKSERAGDSEFPAGTRIRGRVASVTPKQDDTPGQLELEFTSATLPSGERIRLSGELTSLDNKSTTVNDGRITAKGKGGSDKLKVIGIGAAAGFVVGRVLKKDGLLPALLGALGGYLYGNSQNDKPAEAVVPAGATLGVRLNQAVTYSDAGYYQYRSRFNRATN